MQSVSKYQPRRNIINDPEKKVPESIVEQFFSTIKTAKLDRIRDFALTNKIKFNVTESGRTSTGKTPAHVVLELDEKIADNDTKLRILKYLAEMGAPMDLPDKANVWPIHLAANLQSAKIVDFLVQNHVQLDRLDSSNNTPLHYAISGKEIPCDRSLKIKPLVPESRPEEESLNKSLDEINQKLISLLYTQPELNSDLIHMINTIAKIPEMYTDDPNGIYQPDIINLFVETATSPTYASEPSLSGSIIASKIQTRIEQLMDKAYDTINDTLLRGVTSSMNIKPDNTGWGPEIPTGPDTTSAPTKLQQIMDSTIPKMKEEIMNDHVKLKSDITESSSTLVNTMANNRVPLIINNIDRDNLDILVFDTDFKKKAGTENVTLAKMFYLLAYNKYKIDYQNVLADKIINTYPLVDDGLGDQMLNHNYGNPIFVYNKKDLVTGEGFLYLTDLPHLIDNVRFSDERNKIDEAISKTASYYIENKWPTAENCINYQLRTRFTNSDDTLLDLPPTDRGIENELNGMLFTNFDKLVELPDYAKFKSQWITLRKNYSSPTNFNWFLMLQILIEDITPRAAFNDPYAYLVHNIFRTYRAPGDNLPIPLFPHLDFKPLPEGGWLLPKTPFYPRINTPPTLNSYTLYELFRIMYAIQNFMIYGTFGIGARPDIFKEVIGEWPEYVDNVARENNEIVPNKTIGFEYPEFIFLYRILVQKATNDIRDILRNCIQKILNRTLSISYDKIKDILAQNIYIGRLRNYIEPIDNFYPNVLFLPSNPKLEPDDEDDDYENYIENDSSILAPTKKVKWTLDSNLVKWFDKFIKENDAEKLIDKINDYYLSDPERGSTDYFGYDNIHLLRRLIEQSASEMENEVVPIIEHNNFVNAIRKYLGLGTKAPVKDIQSYNFVPTYNTITRNIQLSDTFDDDFERLKSNSSQLGELFFLKETISRFMINIKQRVIYFQQRLNSINYIMADIIAFINNRTYYYIPQIFLPALVSQVVNTILLLFNIKEDIANFDGRRAQFIQFIEMTNFDVIRVITLLNNFIELVRGNLTLVYKEILQIAKYHNNVIKYLNYTSAVQLIDSMTESEGETQINSAQNLFTMNLIPMIALPDFLDETVNFERLRNLFDVYKIPVTAYYSEDDVGGRLGYDFFSLDGDPAIGEEYLIGSYPNMIEYQRRSTDPSKISNSPSAGDNSQLNIIAYKTADSEPLYQINDIPIGIAGIWLRMPDIDWQIYYADAFISYRTDKFKFNWLEGMPASIKELAGRHLLIMKQKVIQNAIQFIVNNKYEESPANPELVELYEDIRKLSNEKMYQNIDDVKIYAVLAKLLDSSINKLMEYSIRQTVIRWIQNLAGEEIPTELSQALNFIQEKEELKVKLNNIEKSALESLLKFHPDKVDLRVPQLEPDLNSIPYTTKPVPEDFIQYLYNIDYNSDSGNINTNKRCYKLNPKIIPKLITGETINSKNSDGNTPLHLAIMSTNPDLVNLLIERGANPTGYTNLLGINAKDLGIQMAMKNLSFTQGTTLIEGLDNFVVPFNDLLMTRLRDAKYKNNIVANVTVGIPIQLVMFNHMFHLYLHNYRHGFSYELANKMVELAKRYESIDTSNVYPIDLFEINNDAKLTEVVSMEMPEERAAKSFNRANQVKKDKLQKQVDQLDTQLEGLTKELSVTIDPKQIEFINQVRLKINNQRDNLQSELMELELDVAKPDDDGMIDLYKTVYQSTVRSMQKRMDRTMDLVEFYKYGFSSLGSSNGFYLSIWRNYFTKRLNETPSMIFQLVNQIFSEIINSNARGKVNSQTVQDLQVLIDFMQLVKDYIESKSPYKMLDDDPLLEEEFKQIAYNINLCLTPAIRNILLEHIYSGLEEMDPVGTIINDQGEVIEAILNSQFNGETIQSYLENVLPMLATKYFNNVYNNPADADRRINKSDDLFLPIIQIIKANKLIELNDESILIRNLREYVVPFATNTYQNFIHHLRLSIYGYERYILNTWKQLLIIQQLI